MGKSRYESFKQPNSIDAKFYRMRDEFFKEAQQLIDRHERDPQVTEEKRTEARGKIQQLELSDLGHVVDEETRKPGSYDAPYVVEAAKRFMEEFDKQHGPQ